MAYQTGTFTSPSDLIATIKAFATANGWSSSGDVVYKGTVFTELVVSGNSIAVRGGTGQSAGVITGPSTKSAYCLGDKIFVPFGAVQNFFTYPANYFLFMDTSPDSIICVMQSNDGLYFNWLCFGMSVKYATYVGGEYFGASYATTATDYPPAMGPHTQADAFNNKKGTMAPLWRTSDVFTNHNAGSNFLVRSDLDVAVNWLGENGAATQVAGNSSVATLLERNPNVWTNQTILLPFWMSIPRPSNLRSIIGLFPPARIVRVTNHEAGDIITLGADKYKVFPFFKKNTSLPDANTLYVNYTGVAESGTMGWAIKYDGP